MLKVLTVQSKEADIETDRQTDRHRDRQTDSLRPVGGGLAPLSDVGAKMEAGYIPLPLACPVLAGHVSLVLIVIHFRLEVKIAD